MDRTILNKRLLFFIRLLAALWLEAVVVMFIYRDAVKYVKIIDYNVSVENKSGVNFSFQLENNSSVNFILSPDSLGEDNKNYKKLIKILKTKECYAPVFKIKDRFPAFHYYFSIFPEIKGFNKWRYSYGNGLIDCITNNAEGTKDEKAR